MHTLFLCLEIFFARILDVSLGTIKTIYIVKEKKITASIISFIEITIWFLVAKEALNSNIHSIFIPLSYGLGYASGTYIGILLSSRLIKGNLTVNVISNKINESKIEYLKNKGFGVSSITLDNNKIYLIIEINKKDLNKLKGCINKLDKNAFIIVHETKYIQNGFFNEV